MLYGISPAKKLTHISDSLTDEQYNCPNCNSLLVRKLGSIKTHHFAHKNLEECDDTDKTMSAWHMGMQRLFPQKFNERIFEDFNKCCKRKADVYFKGHVVEFQHSPLTTTEFVERTSYYLNYNNWFTEDYNYHLEVYGDSDDGLFQMNKSPMKIVKDVTWLFHCAPDSLRWSKRYTDTKFLCHAVSQPQCLRFNPKNSNITLKQYFTDADNKLKIVFDNGEKFIKVNQIYTDYGIKKFLGETFDRNVKNLQLLIQS